MEDDRQYVGPQEACEQQRPMAPMSPNHGMLGGMGTGRGLNKQRGVGGMIDQLSVEAEQLMQVCHKLMEELSPVLLQPQPMPEGGVQTQENAKSASAERIEQEIWKVRRAKMMLMEISQRLDL